MNLLDTIAAVGTPYGKGGIAVVRISGADALSVAKKIFFPNGRDSIDTPRRTVYGSICTSRDGHLQQIDDGIATFFKGPASFTGEDTVEISCHGGILVTQRVLEAALCNGARHAMAGEFTKRAFINGKISLTRAEATGDLLNAETDDQIKLARSGINGKLSESVNEIYNDICAVLAAIYAHIDYPDEDLADISSDEMLDVVTKSIERLERLVKTYSTGHAVREGIATAIVGKANAGKSTLYNGIVGRDAAIVTDIEGTTRDVLTEIATLGRVTLRLSDTAGLRESIDAVERIGIERAMREAEKSELILAVFDGSSEPSEDDLDLVKYLKGLDGIKIAVVNKTDIGVNEDMLKLAEELNYCVCLSAKELDGFDRLAETVESIYVDSNIDMGNDAVVSNARQNAALSIAAERLTAVAESLRHGLPLEVCCVEAENALSSLGELDGKIASEDVISKIFSDFCVGK